MLNLKGNKHLKNKEYDKAISTYKKGIDLIRELSNFVDRSIAAIVYSNLGVAYFQNENYEEAEKA